MRLLLLLSSLVITSLVSGQVTVETFIPAGSGVNDALVLGPDGNLYGSDFGTFGAPGTSVSRIDLNDKTVTVYKDGMTNSNGIGFVANGDIYIASYTDATVRRAHPTTPQSVFATATSGNLSGLIVHPTTDVVYVTNCANNTVEIVENFSLTPFLSNDGSQPALNCPVGLAVDDDGNLYVSNFSDGIIMRVTSSSERTEIADLDGPNFNTTGFITHANGSLYATGIGTHVIQEVKLEDGSVSTLAGTGASGSIDGAANEAQFDAPNGIVASVTGDSLFVSEFNSGAIRLIKLSTMTSVEPTDLPVQSSRLDSSYPNPFLDETTVRFTIDSPQRVSVSVYDVLGREIAVLTNREWLTGSHEVKFGAETLSSGTYLIRMETPSNSETIRVLVAR